MLLTVVDVQQLGGELRNRVSILGTRHCSSYSYNHKQLQILICRSMDPDNFPINPETQQISCCWQGYVCVCMCVRGRFEFSSSNSGSRHNRYLVCVQFQILRDRTGIM
jgi:hypothetical protein